MERYKITKVLGDGTYGSVLRGEHRGNKGVVAVKKMKRKFYSWEECMALREVKVLRRLIHPNIVKLKEVVRENNDLHLVFEHMDTNLYSLIKDRARGLPEGKVRSIVYQLMKGLDWMHKQGYMHRDIKPENLLVTKDVVKIADFGLAREVRARPPFTDYVSTRWYRAPEVVLRILTYSTPVDVWAVGALIPELYTLRPLFPGSNEADQINKICSVLGTPTEQTWSEGLKQARSINMRLPQYVPVPFATLVPNASPDGQDLIQRMLFWNPQRRPDAAGCMNHRYFAGFTLPDVSPAKGATERKPSIDGTTSRQSDTKSSDGKNSRQSSHTNWRQASPDSQRGGSGQGALPSITGALGPSLAGFARDTRSDSSGPGSRRGSGSKHAKYGVPRAEPSVPAAYKAQMRPAPDGPFGQPQPQAKPSYVPQGMPASRQRLGPGLGQGPEWTKGHGPLHGPGHGHGLDKGHGGFGHGVDKGHGGFAHGSGNAHGLDKGLGGFGHGLGVGHGLDKGHGLGVGHGPGHGSGHGHGLDKGHGGFGQGSHALDKGHGPLHGPAHAHGLGGVGHGLGVGSGLGVGGVGLGGGLPGLGGVPGLGGLGQPAGAGPGLLGLRQNRSAFAAAGRNLLR